MPDLTTTQRMEQQWLKLCTQHYFSMSRVCITVQMPPTTQVQLGLVIGGFQTWPTRCEGNLAEQTNGGSLVSSLAARSSELQVHMQMLYSMVNAPPVIRRFCSKSH